MEKDPFHVFLQCTVFWKDDQQVLCRLLCTSKSVRTMLLQKFAGMASIKFASHTTERALQFTPWLARHGILLHTLDLNINTCTSSWHEVEASMAAALQQAAVGAPYSMLQV